MTFKDEFISEKDGVVVEFTSDSSVSGGGFELEYTLISKEGNGGCYLRSLFDGLLWKGLVFGELYSVSL